MTLRRATRVLRLCAVLLSFVGVMCAQDSRATLTGRVSDPSGAPVPGAKVVVKNLKTNVEAVTNTTDDGAYTVPFLDPGDYSVTVTSPNFKSAVKDKITLFVSSTTTLNVPMEVGTVQESVTVSAEAPLLEADTASRGGVIENMRITELPLSGRNPFNLANLTTGVQFQGNPQFTRPFDNGDNVNFSINGGLRQTNAYLIDGIPNDAVTDAAGDRSHSNQNIAYIPSVDTTQEFKIITNSYDAQYGRTGGGIVSVSTKSGTNAIHGTGYEFLRRYQLDANSLQSNAAGRPRYTIDPVTKENLGGHKLDQYGFQLNGPAYIPKLYNGKDKTFWMFGFENYVESTPSPILTSVPDPAWRNGNFSNAGVTIYDPFSTVVNPSFNSSQPVSASNPQYIRTPFAGNIIPTNRINPVGQAILKAYPEPNLSSSTPGVNNFVASPNLSEDHFKNWIARVDQNFGQKERMFFRYAHNRRNQIDNGANGFTGIGRDAQDPLVRINDNAVVDSTTVLSPSMVLNLRAGYTRFVQAAYRQSVTPFDATSLGFPASFSNNRFTSIPPRIEFPGANLPTFGSRNPNSNITNLISLSASLQKIMGKHSLKFGAEYRDFRVNVSGGSFVYGGGDFQFTNAFTGIPGVSGSGLGQPYASLILGVPTQSLIQYTPQLAFHWPYTALFAQDDIKLTRRLTVNLGLRWDVEGSPTERYNRMNRGFGYNETSPLASAASVRAAAADCPSCANLRGGLLFAGTSGQSNHAFKTKYTNFQPRVGVAYQAAQRTVIRGGYGIFFLPEAAYGASQGFAQDTTFLNTSGGGAQAFIPATTLSNPFPTGILQASGSSLGLNTFAGQSIIFNNPNRLIPFVHEYSIGVQHQLPKDIRIDLSYVGSRTVHVNTNDNQAGGGRNINDNTPEQYAQARGNPSYFSQQVTNPFFNVIQGGIGANATISRQQLLRPYPQFNGVVVAQESVGKLWYDSLQLNIEKRFSGGLTTVLAYTWSKNLQGLSFLNPYDRAPVKEIAPQDRTNRLVWSGVWQMPFGKGRKFGGNWNRAAELIVGGWEYTWIVQAATGVPVQLNSSYDLIGNPTVSNQGFGNWINACVLQTNGTTRAPNDTRNAFVSGCSSPAFAVRGANTLRTIPNYITSLRQPWRTTADMSVNKRFNFTERVNFQFRAEAFNVFNTPIRGGVNNDPGSLQFGFVAPNQSNSPRNVQLGFKVNF